MAEAGEGRGQAAVRGGCEAVFAHGLIDAIERICRESGIEQFGDAVSHGGSFLFMVAGRILLPVYRDYLSWKGAILQPTISISC